MCWKKKPIANVKRHGLLFACNNYPGSQNDLNGCINDQNDVIAKFTPLGFTFDKFKDSEVTKSNFRNTIKNYVLGMTSGDILLIHYSGHGSQVWDKEGDEPDGYDETLYLYDGNFTDDEFNEVLSLIPEGAKVIIALDSCHSGTATKDLRRGRFMPPEEMPKKKLNRRKKLGSSSEMNWNVFSGCRDNQTSADAYIDGRYNGAFTWAWLKSFSPEMTYKEWLNATVYALYKAKYEQVPTLEGSFVDEKVFS